MALSAKDSLIAEYKDTIAKQNTTIENLNLVIKSLRETIAENTETNKNLQEQIDYLTKKLFGASSEKRQMDGQLSLFDEAEVEADASYSNIDTVVKGHTRKPKRTYAETFKGIPVEEEVLDLPDNEKKCRECGSDLVPIGRELVRKEFHYTPAKGKVIEIYTLTYKCPECTSGSTPEKSYEIVKAEAPEALIPHSYASTSSVAWVMYQKYANAIPLYRQEQDWKQLGASFSRSTLANWIIYSAKHYLSPVYEYFHKELIKRHFLMADETRIQVLKEPGRNPETDSFMWLFRSGEDGEPPIVLYKYYMTRAGYNPEEFLKGFSGYLETDGYQGYNKVENIKRCCCWAHVRRYFIDAVPKGKEFDMTNPAVQGVRYCDKLFEYEKQYREKGYSFDKKHDCRLRDEQPVLEAFWSWAEKQVPTKGSRFAKAINYVLNRKDYLMTYLEDGRCSFDNNASENAIRPFTLGRKNWLFSNSTEGAEASAIVYTMVEMAKAHGLNIYGYLLLLLESRPSDGWTDEQFEEIAPWNAEIQKLIGNK